MSVPVYLPEKVSVLVVDDSDDQRALLRRYFERAGCVVTTVKNAEDAITAYTRATPDLAVIDLVLPGMSGWQLTERLRADLPDCVIAVTSVLDASAYPPSEATLPKPFTGAQIRTVLRDFVPKWTQI
ncbi:response regulator [Glaciihabitans sp. INWT7]|uniref:response regulator n=1 Tax=Glaciihabitans sp. INWT7 TaxID=2596912 RepID=UPI001628A63A|nr:response regulator [Glaciihabitans sp. INWT7]QNE46249.1 response regulator [Glaciihabitans sp. INWT7]